MKSVIQSFCEQHSQEFDQIPDDRKIVLKKIAAYIKYKENEPIDLLFVCTHNSRRSLFAQIWAKVAAHYYGFSNVETYSAGTVATEFNGNVVYALMHQGFDMWVEGETHNSVHHMIFDSKKNAAVCFSKELDHFINPTESFAAIMTCNDADQNCPFVPGCELRVALPYVDPKSSDGTDIQTETYLKTSIEIAREMLYLFSIAGSK
jgi:arsenate reductase (thioredoxin)